MNGFISQVEQDVIITSKEAQLQGLLYLPEKARSIVLLMQGSGNSRFSTRDQYLAHGLNAANHATLLFDLLTSEEISIDNQTHEFRFDIPLLTSRLIDATHWCLNNLAPYHLSISYFGADTGATAALIAAAQESLVVKAVVSRGGRPDLAREYLSDVKAPTLLLVGQNDEALIDFNELAKTYMACPVQLKIIPGASHAFEESGKLKEIAHLAKAWFDHYSLEEPIAAK